MNEMRGSCHCGNVEFTLFTEKSADDLVPAGVPAPCAGGMAQATSPIPTHVWRCAIATDRCSVLTGSATARLSGSYAPSVVCLPRCFVRSRDACAQWSGCNPWWSTPSEARSVDGLRVRVHRGASCAKSKDLDRHR